MKHLSITNGMDLPVRPGGIFRRKSDCSPLRYLPWAAVLMLWLTLTGSIRAQTTTPAVEFRKDSLFTNPSLEIDPNSNDPYYWLYCADGYVTQPQENFGSNMAATDGQNYFGIYSAINYTGAFSNGVFYQRLKYPLLPGKTYKFSVDVACVPKFVPDEQATGTRYLPSGFATLNVLASTATTPVSFCSSKTVVWQKTYTNTTWQKDTVSITNTGNQPIRYLGFECRPAQSNTRTGLVLDNLRTLDGLTLLNKQQQAVAGGKEFKVYWQAILKRAGFDSLFIKPTLKGTLTTVAGGRVSFPTSVQVTNARGFYILKEAAPAEGQDTLYYGLSVRNTLVNGVKDDTLRDLYSCKVYGKQSDLLSDTLRALDIENIYTIDIPKEIVLAHRPAVDTVYSRYEQLTGGKSNSFEGSSSSISFTTTGSWTIADGAATTGVYQPNQLSELTSGSILLDTTIANNTTRQALTGFALYCDEKYQLESGHDYGAVYIQHQKADQSWSDWTLMSLRSGQNPETGTRTTYISLRDTVYWNKNIRVKFSLQSDCGSQYNGWTIAEVFVRQIVTSEEIFVALQPIPARLPFTLYKPSGVPLQNPFNGFNRLVVPALTRLKQNKCRVDITFVIDGRPGSTAIDLPRVFNTGLDQLKELLYQAGQGDCKQVRFMIAGGNQAEKPQGGYYERFAIGNQGAHFNLVEADLAGIKNQIGQRIARNETENRVASPKLAGAIYDYVGQNYAGPPEPGVKRVMIVLNNRQWAFEQVSVTLANGTSVDFDTFTKMLSDKGITLIVNTPMFGGLASSLTANNSVLERAAKEKYNKLELNNLLVDYAAEDVCEENEPGCCDFTASLDAAKINTIKANNTEVNNLFTKLGSPAGQGTSGPIFSDLSSYLTVFGTEQHLNKYSRECMQGLFAKFCLGRLSDGRQVFFITRPLDHQQSREADPVALETLMRQYYGKCVVKVWAGCVSYGTWGKLVNANDDKKYLHFTNYNYPSLKNQGELGLGRIVKASEALSRYPRYDIYDELYAYLRSKTLGSATLSSLTIDYYSSLLPKDALFPINNEASPNYPEPDFAPVAGQDFSWLNQLKRMEGPKWEAEDADGKYFYANEPFVSSTVTEESRAFYRCEFRSVDGKYYLYNIQTDQKVNLKNPTINENELLYVLDCRGRFYVRDYNEPSSSFIDKRWSHSQFLGGAAVITAGIMEISNGIIQTIDNSSGHYAPSCESLDNTLSNYLDDFGYTYVNWTKSISQINNRICTFTYLSPSTARTVGSQPSGQARTTEPTTPIVVHPNPFTGEFTVTYSLPSTEEVTLALHSVTGTDHTRQLNKPALPVQSPTGGTYQITVDGKSLAAGMYVLTLVGKNGYRQQQRLVKIH